LGQESAHFFASTGLVAGAEARLALACAIDFTTSEAGRTTGDIEMPPLSPALPKRVVVRPANRPETPKTGRPVVEMWME